MATYREYLQVAMRRAKFEQMDSGEWFASIPGFDGLWVTGSTGEEARKELLRPSKVGLQFRPGTARIRCPKSTAPVRKCDAYESTKSHI